MKTNVQKTGTGTPHSESEEYRTVPLPRHLIHLHDPQRRPLLVGTREVRELVEHWGFTRNGEEYVKKLVRGGVLVRVQVLKQRGNRYETTAVLALWEKARS